MNEGRKSPVRSKSPIAQSQRDLVTAKMAVTAPPGSLTGGLGQVERTGKNTAWAKGVQPQDTSVPKYASRKEYLETHHADHPFAKDFMQRHVGSTPPEDKRGLSCAEGHSLIESHKILETAGQEAAQGNLETFKASLIPKIPEPTFTKNTKRTHKVRMLNAFEKKVRARETDLNKMAKDLTGMDSWEEYARKEAGFMAWNDIQQHGKLSDIRHDLKSDVSPGEQMSPCVKCRTEIVEKMRK